MSISRRFALKAKAFSQLGPTQSLNYLAYQVGLRSGYFKLATPALDINVLLSDEELHPTWFMVLPDIKNLLQISDLQASTLFRDAGEILDKKLRLFGEVLQPLEFIPQNEPLHWTCYESGSFDPGIEDIKFVWEPARFNWAITLGKAYYLYGDEKYASTFWQLFEEFTRSNPTNKGLNWTSAQEVALRLIALVISAQIFKDSSHTTPQRLKTLAVSVADHADRIPSTICYARAQNNNHLVSEAVGLYTAAVFLPDHPHAERWLELGLKWFNHAVLTQIAPDGCYIQHSTNYHRLFLMLALWMQYLFERTGETLQDEVLNRLASASEWLAARLDSISGHVPNLGHNDGSHILPFSNCTYDDYRPVVQAASRIFLAKPALPPGPWDDLCLWLDMPISVKLKKNAVKQSEKHLIIGSDQDWAVMNAAVFSARPAHADQLHVDIWHAGLNIAMDAGTFQYNAAPPWKNSLAATCVHNTITVNNLDQMTRAGKFLWLDWAQAEVIEQSAQSITAVHSGYTHLGILHRRTLRREKDNCWVIVDELLPSGQASTDPAASFQACLNWLLPDWPYHIENEKVILDGPAGEITLTIHKEGLPGSLDIFKASKSDLSKKSDANLGWYSPTYGLKIPALSVRFSVSQPVPLKITSTFNLGK